MASIFLINELNNFKNVILKIYLKKNIKLYICNEKSFEIKLSVEVQKKKKRKRFELINFKIQFSIDNIFIIYKWTWFAELRMPLK